MVDSDQVNEALLEWVKVFMHGSMQDFKKWLDEVNLSRSQVGVLFHLHREGSMGVSDLGDHLGVTKAAVSQMLDRLVQQGLIQRTENPDDRRVKQISLTEKGVEKFQESLRARTDWLAELAEMLTVSEKEDVAAAIKILIEKTSQLKRSNCQRY